MLNQINTEKISSRDTVETEITDMLAAGVKSCIAIDGLDAIAELDTELVIWHRTLPARFNEWVELLTPSILPHLRILVEPGDVRSALEPMLNECGLPKDSMRELMIDDITDLVQVFSRITDSERVDLRLEHIDHDACWRFHIDNVEARLLTTYLGAATEWVQPAYAQRAIKTQKEFAGPLERLTINDVAIFKGNSTDRANGIVHRSPPIESTGESRLLLCLNQPSEVSPTPWDKY